MPRFYFHLRARGRIHTDAEGTELPDVEAARAHAVAVADELLRHAQAGTRHWSLCVEEHSREPAGNAGDAQRLDFFFADVDPSLASFSPQMRSLVSATSRRLSALTDAMRNAQATRIESRALLARARGRPQLAYVRGE